MRLRTLVVVAASLSAISLPLYAGISGGKAVYRGGTISNLKEGTEGIFSTKDEKELVFDFKKDKFTIPYDRIDSLEYGQKAGRRVGLAIAVSPVALLSKKRRHYLTVNFKDALRFNRLNLRSHWLRS